MAGGQELPIQSWDKDHIVCTLPATGAGSNGDVVVPVPGECLWLTGLQLPDTKLGGAMTVEWQAAVTAISPATLDAPR